MRKLFYIAWLCVTFAACSKEELPDNLSGDDAASLTLSINMTQNKVITRADETPPYERRIFNLYVFVFNADGTVNYQHFDDLGGVSILDQKMLKIDMLTCGSEKTVAVVANIDEANSIVDLPVTQLDAITTLAELNALVVKMQTESIDWGTSFLMSGIENNVTITANQTNPISVALTRVYSKVRFNISTKEGVTFIPSDWRLISLPAAISVMEGEHTNVCNEKGKCFDTEWKKYDASADISFSFYSMEHRPTFTKAIPVDDPITNTPMSDAARYALREKQNKTTVGNSVTNGASTYAPATGTYVEMRGYVTYVDETDKVDRSADVIYKVHLGGGVKEVDNYNTLRNTSYIYNVKILSVNAIETEVLSTVNDENEQRPGAEGNVTAAKYIIEFDAHNEVRRMTFNQKDVATDLTWDVHTSFSSGSATDDPHPTDYKWIHFQINEKTGGIYNDKLRTYPGDTELYTQDIKNYPTSGTKQLLDVDQLVELLKIGSSIGLFDGNGDVKFTAFVDEHYYEVDPNTLTTNLNLWKEFTNQQQRVMNILSNMKYSPDRKSTRSNAVYSIRQHAIQTMYNRKLDENDYRAWGTQVGQNNTPVEFEQVNSGYHLDANDLSNGRKNTIQLWRGGGTAWTTYINLPTWEMNPNYNAVKYKCLRMNRDNNGNNTIDESEVQWYLASINQLTDIWIGEWSYNPAARLYQGTNWPTDEQYFASSTVLRHTGSREDPQVLWSSEGSSVGYLSGAGGIGSKVYYRCVRNLGIARDARIDVEPSELVEYTAGESTEPGIMSLRRLDAQSIRSYYQASEELPVHHERSTANKPYWAFTVSKTVVGGNDFTWTSLYEAIQNKRRPCTDGYRVPNQRELALMYSRIKNDGNWKSTNHFSRTSFQFSTSRPGFSVKIENEVMYFYLLQLGGYSGGVRCVKDVPPTM